MEAGRPGCLEARKLQRQEDLEILTFEYHACQLSSFPACQPLYTFYPNTRGKAGYFISTCPIWDSIQGCQINKSFNII